MNELVELGSSSGQGHGHVCLALPILVMSWAFKGAAAVFAHLDRLAFHIPWRHSLSFLAKVVFCRWLLRMNCGCGFFCLASAKGTSGFLVMTSVYSGFSQRPEVWLDPLNFHFLSTLTDLFSHV